MGSEYYHMAFNLIGVLVLMFVLFYCMKRLKAAKYAKNKHINIINVLPVGAKEKIILLEVQGSMILIGATPSHINTLHVFNKFEQTKEIDFAEQMKNLVTKS